MYRGMASAEGRAGRDLRGRMTPASRPIRTEQMLRRLLALAGLFLAAASRRPRPGGNMAMRRVAAIAWLEAKPETRAAIRRLLAHVGLLETPTCPLADDRAGEHLAGLRQDARRAVQLRLRPGTIRMSTSASRSTSKGACRDGNCVSAQIERNAQIARRQGRIRRKCRARAAHGEGDQAKPGGGVTWRVT